MAQEYANIILGVSRNLASAGIFWLWRNIRTAIRGYSGTEGLKAKLRAQGLKPEEIEKAVEKHNKPFVMAQKVEDRIEKIPNKFLKAFVEEAYEEFGDACVEAGFVLAGGLDEYAYQKNLFEEQFRATDIIEIDFKDDGTKKMKKVQPLPDEPKIKT